MNDDEKIRSIIYSLETHALGDIKKASAGESRLGAFILCSCLIDAMAGFVGDSDRIGVNYKNFVRAYLPTYNPSKLYKDLRCKLVHSYSEGGSYVFTHVTSLVHLQPTSDARLCINLESFIADVEKALELLSSKLQNPNEVTLRRNAVSRYDRNNGIIQLFTSQVLFMSHAVSGSVS